jgi:23S rRNA (cytidine1920-2'-O)/16S rRNA (cytidine1409-2'-O)-methyltransferase
MRLDRLLVEKGLVESREKAARVIMAGEVLVDGQRLDKASALVSTETELEIKGRSPYISRGGEKLAHALDHFGTNVKTRICVDIGASTGGFTDCLLQRGASMVYAVDVGTGQLDDKLRKDPRVIVMEHTNARTLDPRLFGDAPTLAVVDVAFISLEKVLPAIFGVLAPRGEVITLVKPQFEAGREDVGKGGIVRDVEVQQRVVEAVTTAAAQLGLTRAGLIESPITGMEGNREFLIHLRRA